MHYLSTMTTQGQVTIPKAIRTRLNIAPSERVLFIEKDGEVIIKSAKSFLDLKGAISQKAVPDEKTDKKVLDYVKNEYGKK